MTTTDDLYDLTGRTAVITGAARGIGYAIARQFLAAGSTVVVLDSNADALENAVARLRTEFDRVAGWVCDVTDEAHAAATIARASSDFSEVDVLVNNAGISNHCPPETLAPADWRRVIDVDLTGTFVMSQAVAQGLLAADLPGAIVNLSSIAGTTSLGRGIFAYGAAKAGVDQLTRELAVEWGAFGIRVNAIAPCQVETEGFRAVAASNSTADDDLVDRVLAGIPLGRLAQSEDIAHAAHFLVSRAAAMVTGVVLPVDGGNLALNAGATLRRR